MMCYGKSIKYHAQYHEFCCGSISNIGVYFQIQDSFNSIKYYEIVTEGKKKHKSYVTSKTFRYDLQIRFHDEPTK